MKVLGEPYNPTICPPRDGADETQIASQGDEWILITAAEEHKA